MRYEIKNRWTGGLIYSAEADSWGQALKEAQKNGANLWGANLLDADLRGANLQRANLRGANLLDADLPSPAEVLSASRGELSDMLTTELMRYDASFHPNPEAFTRWARGGSCPFEGLKIRRAADFRENRKLWSPGLPKSGYELMVAVLREKAKTNL